MGQIAPAGARSPQRIRERHRLVWKIAAVDTASAERGGIGSPSRLYVPPQSTPESNGVIYPAIIAMAKNAGSHQ